MLHSAARDLLADDHVRRVSRGVRGTMSSRETDNQSGFAPILTAAEQTLSKTLGRPVRLGETTPLTEKGRRNVVLRCRDLSGGSPASFIIKQVATEHYDPRD